MGPSKTLCGLTCVAILVTSARCALGEDTSAHDYAIDADLQDTTPISPTLFGIFFEEVCPRPVMYPA